MNRRPPRPYGKGEAAILLREITQDTLHRQRDITFLAVGAASGAIRLARGPMRLRHQS
jgi:hypothetical protein